MKIYKMKSQRAIKSTANISLNFSAQIGIFYSFVNGEFTTWG
jgi:hypothetical protein